MSRYKQTENLKILLHISQAVGSVLDLQEILHRVVDMVAKVTQAQSCLLYLYNSQQQELVLMASKNPHPKMLGRLRLKMGEGITGWVAKEKKTVAISNNASEDARFKFFHNLPEDVYEAFLSVPIFHKERLIGVMNLQKKKAYRWSPSIIELMEAIAVLVGSAIENARLFREAQNKANQIEALSKVSHTIVSSGYLGEILNLIVAVTAEMMGSKICSIMLLDKTGQELAIKATQSLSKNYRQKPPLKVARSVSGIAVREKRTVTILDVRDDKRFAYSELANEEGLVSLLCVPMMIKDRVIGVINTYTSSRHVFEEEEIKILQAIANQAAVAIENTNLMDDALANKEALVSRKMVERAKGILMKERGITEEAAYKFIQQQSMNIRKTMKEVAEAIILASEIKM